MGGMSRRCRAWVGAVLVAAVASAVAAQPVDEVTRLEAPALMRGDGAISQRSATPSDQPLLLFHYFNVATDCRPSDVTFRLATPPAHGTVGFVASQNRPFAGGRPLFAAGDPRARCADRLVPSRDAVYTPAPGYAGQDSFVIEVSEGGTVTSDAVNVLVLSFGKPFRAAYPRQAP
jgi:hypothetical protein